MTHPKCFLCGTEHDVIPLDKICDSCRSVGTVMSGQEALDMLNALIQTGIVSFEDLEDAKYEL
jgi:hypothetical protein